MTDEALLWILLAGGATGVGGAALLLVRQPSPLLLDGLLGFTAGVMLAATSFSLLVPALDVGAVWEVVLGFAVGAALLAAIDLAVPHVHAYFTERGHERGPLPRSFLLLIAITIHNVPEGLAVGVAFAAGGAELGVPIAVAIAIQNVPEGFAAGAPLLQSGWSRRAVVGVAALTGLVEPPAALAALGALDLAGALLPAALAFAGGAMLYVVVDELIPESHGRGNERVATLALLVGFALMLALDNAF